MRILLEPMLQRWLDIVDLLIVENGWITKKELAEKLFVSEKTISNDLKDLEELYPDYFTLDVSFVYGIRLLDRSSTKLSLLQIQILNVSKNVQLMVELFLQPHQEMSFYAEIVGMSRSHLYKKINEINDELSDIGLEITAKKNKYFVYGNSEILVRRFYGRLLLELNNFDANTFTFYQVSEEMKQKIEACVDEMDCSQFATYFSYAITFFYVSLLREEQGFCLIYTTEETSVDRASNSDDVSNELLQAIKDSFSMSPMTHVLYNHSRLEKVKTYLKDRYKNECKDQKEEALHYFYKLTEYCYINEIFYQTPHYMFVNRFFHFSNEVKTHHYLSYCQINKVILDISKLLECDLSGYVDTYIYANYVYFPYAFYSNPSLTIYVNSNLSNYHAKFLASYLESTLGVRTDLMEENQINESEFYRSGIMVTNNHRIKKEKVICVDDYPTKGDIKRVNDQINLFYCRTTT